MLISKNNLYNNYYKIRLAPLLIFLLMSEFLGAQYCVPGTNINSTSAGFTRVSMGMFNINIPICGSGRMQVFTTQQSLYAGQTFYLNSEYSRCGAIGGPPYSTISVFADWNADMDFEDANEYIGSQVNQYYESTSSIIIGVPLTINTGSITRIRITADDFANTDYVACGQHSKTIDLEVNLIAIPPYSAKVNPLFATQITSRSVQLHWDDNSGVESSYIVERSDDSINFQTISILPANTVVYGDSGINPGSKYYYRVNAQGNHPDSASTLSLYTQFADFRWESQLFSYPGTSNAVYWNDFDNDNLLDLFLPTSSEISYGGIGYALWKNNGTSYSITQNEFHTGAGASWIDIDNDGDDDLYLSSVQFSINNSYPNNLFENNGNSSFSLIPSFLSDTTIISTSWSDYNKDGFLDALVNYKSSLTKRLYRNNGNKTFTAVLSFSNSFNPAVFADYDGDGDQDVVTISTTKAVYELVDTIFLPLSFNPFIPYNSQNKGSSWGDLDNNGLPDVYVSNEVGTFSSLYKGISKNIFSHSTMNGNVVSSTIGDYDNDGYLDLFVCRSPTGTSLYRNDGTGNLVEQSTDIFINENYPLPFGKFEGKAAAWADYNNDGFLDFFLVIADNSPGRLYTNRKNNNNWVQFKLTGTASNKNAIGSRIRIKSGGKWQYRWIQSNTGPNSQNDLTVSFGLGSNTIVDSLEIKWPLGDIQVISIPAINQKHLILEPPIIEHRWIGGISSAWHDPLNWSLSRIPDAFSNVIIEAGKPECIVSSPAICRLLTIASGAIIRLNATIEIRK